VLAANTPAHRLVGSTVSTTGETVNRKGTIAFLQEKGIFIPSLVNASRASKKQTSDRRGRVKVWRESTPAHGSVGMANSITGSEIINRKGSRRVIVEADRVARISHTRWGMASIPSTLYQGGGGRGAVVVGVLLVALVVATCERMVVTWFLAVPCVHGPIFLMKGKHGGGSEIDTVGVVGEGVVTTKVIFQEPVLVTCRVPES
jgi:hypothetical protein